MFFDLNVSNLFALIGASYLFYLLLHLFLVLDEYLDAKSLQKNASIWITMSYWFVHAVYIALFAIHFLLIPVLLIEAMDLYFHKKAVVRGVKYDKEDIESGKVTLLEAYPHLAKYFDSKYLRPQPYWDEDIDAIL